MKKNRKSGARGVMGGHARRSSCTRAAGALSRAKRRASYPRADGEEMR